MTRTPLLISHHPPSQHDRCVPIGGWMVCARCLGLYPLLLVLLLVQVALRMPVSIPGDALIAMLLPVPALIDWSRGRFDPRTGRNAVRVATGALLAVALARTIYLHIRQPLHPLAVTQFVAIALAAATVEVAVRWRSATRVDPDLASDVEPPDEKCSGQIEGGQSSRMGAFWPGMAGSGNHERD